MINTLTRWEPFQELEDLQNRLSNVFSRAPRQGNGREGLTLADWSPLADITEDDKEYVVKAELPAIKKEDVKVTDENGVLAISGDRKLEKEDKRSHRMEQANDSFFRSFTLPADPNPRKIRPRFKDVA